MNKVILEGNVYSEPCYGKGGRIFFVCDTEPIRIGVVRFVQEGDAKPCLNKGDKVKVTGHLKWYKNKNDAWDVEVIADTLIIQTDPDPDLDKIVMIHGSYRRIPE